MAEEMKNIAEAVAGNTAISDGDASQMTISEKLKEAKGNISRHNQDERTRKTEEEKLRKRSAEENKVRLVESEKKQQQIEKQASRDEQEALAEFKQNRNSQKRENRNKQKALLEENMRKEEERRRKKEEQEREIAALLEKERAEAQARKERAEAILKRGAAKPELSPSVKQETASEATVDDAQTKNEINPPVVEQAPIENEAAPIAEAANIETPALPSEKNITENQPPLFRNKISDADREAGARAAIKGFFGYNPNEEPEDDNCVITVGEPEEEEPEVNIIGPDDEIEDDGIITVTPDEQDEDEVASDSGNVSPSNSDYNAYDPEAYKLYNEAWTDYINKQNEMYAAMSAQNMQYSVPATAASSEQKPKPAVKKQDAPAVKQKISEKPDSNSAPSEDKEEIKATIVPVINALPKTSELQNEAEDEVAPILPISDEENEPSNSETEDEIKEEAQAEDAQIEEAQAEDIQSEDKEAEEIDNTPAEEDPDFAEEDAVGSGVVVEESTPEEVKQGAVKAFEIAQRKKKVDEADSVEDKSEDVIPPLNVDDDIVAAILAEGLLVENKKQLKKYLSHSDKAVSFFAGKIKKEDKLLDKKAEEATAPEILVDIIKSDAKILTIKCDNVTTAARIGNEKATEKSATELAEAIEEYNSRVGSYKILTGEGLTKLSAFLPEHLVGQTGIAVIPTLFYRDNYVEIEVDRNGIPVEQNDSVATTVINPSYSALGALGALECRSKSDASALARKAKNLMSKLSASIRGIEKAIAKNAQTIEHSKAIEAHAIESRENDIRALNAKIPEEKRESKKYNKKLRKIDNKYGNALRGIRKERARLDLENKNARLLAERFATERERVATYEEVLCAIRGFAGDKTRVDVKRELVAALISFDKCIKNCSIAYGKPFTPVTSAIADEVAINGNIHALPKIACRKELCEVVGDRFRVVGDRVKARELAPDIKPPKAQETNSFDAEDPLENGAYVREGLLIDALVIAGETVNNRKSYKRYRKKAKKILKVLEKTVKQSDKAIFRAVNKNDAEFAIAENLRVRSKLLAAKKHILSIALRANVNADKDQNKLYSEIEAYNNRTIDYRSVTGQKFRRISAFLPENIVNENGEADIPVIHYSEHYFEAFAKNAEATRGYADPFGKGYDYVPVAYPNRRYTENPTVMTTVINPPYSAAEKVELDSVDDYGEYRSSRWREYFILKKLKKALRRLKRRRRKNDRRAVKFENKLNKLNKKQDKAVFALESLVPESERDKPEYRKRLLSVTRKIRRSLVKLKFKRLGAAISRTAIQIDAEELVIYREKVAVYARSLYNLRGYGRPGALANGKDALLSAIRDYNKLAKKFSRTAREPIARISTEIIDSIVREGRLYTFPRLLLCREIVETVGSDRRTVGDKYRYGMPYSVNARGIAVKTGTNFMVSDLGCSLVTVGPDFEPVFGSVSSDFKYIGEPNPKGGKEARRAPADLDRLSKEEAQRVKDEIAEIEAGYNSYTIAPVSLEVGVIEDNVVDALAVKSRAVSSARELAYMLRRSKKAVKKLWKLVRVSNKAVVDIENKPIREYKEALHRAIAEDIAARNYVEKNALSGILPMYFSLDGKLRSVTTVLDKALSHRDYSTANEAIYELSELLESAEHKLVDMAQLRYEECIASQTPLHDEVKALADVYLAKKRPKYSKFDKKLEKKLSKYDTFLKANLRAFALSLWSEVNPSFNDELARAEARLEALIEKVYEEINSDKKADGEQTVLNVRRALDKASSEIIEYRLDKLAAIGSIVNVRRMNLYAASKIEIGVGAAAKLALKGHGFRAKARLKRKLADVISIYNSEVSALDKYLGDDKLSPISPLIPEELASRNDTTPIPEIVSCERFTEAYYSGDSISAELQERSEVYKSAEDFGFVAEDINRIDTAVQKDAMPDDVKITSKRSYNRFTKSYRAAQDSIDGQISALASAIASAVSRLDKIRDKKIKRTERYNKAVLRITKRTRKTYVTQKRLSRCLAKYRKKILKLDQKARALNTLSKMRKGKSAITDVLGAVKGYDGIIKCGAAERINLERRRLMLACRYLRAVLSGAAEKNRTAFITAAKSELTLAMAHYNRCIRESATLLSERELNEVSGSLPVDVMDTGLELSEIEEQIPEIAYLKVVAEYLGDRMIPIRKRS